MPRPALPGTWSAELSYPDDYGTLERLTVHGRTQAEVRAKLPDARERIESGTGQGRLHDGRRVARGTDLEAALDIVSRDGLIAATLRQQ